MKLKIVAFVSAMMLGSLVGKGQSHDVTLNPVLFFVDNYSGSYFYNLPELPFSMGMTLGFIRNLQYSFPEDIVLNTTLEDPNHSGFYLVPEFRLYGKPDEVTTNWVGLYVKYRSYATSDNAYTFTTLQGDSYSFDARHTRTSVGLNFGRNWLLEDIFVISGWLGFGYVFYDNLQYTNDVQNVNGIDVITLPRLDMRLGVSVGLRL